MSGRNKDAKVCKAKREIENNFVRKKEQLKNSVCSVTCCLEMMLKLLQQPCNQGPLALRLGEGRRGEEQRRHKFG
jgi:hypothetical protein